MMCNTWKYPTSLEDEVPLSIIEKLPSGFSFVNITGGEPFLREDLEDIVASLRSKTKRLVISTNGYFTERILDLARRHPWVGIRVSIEGLQATNDAIRRLPDGFERGLMTLTSLRQMGIKDIGFGMTFSDLNWFDMIPLFRLAAENRFEFATAAVHNSYYFHKLDNVITRKYEMIESLESLIDALLRSSRPKNWFRAYFNYGLCRYISGLPRDLPCGAMTDVIFVDPYGYVKPCNGMDLTVGNLKDCSLDMILKSGKAVQAKQAVRNCSKHCWMVGTAAPAMKKHLARTACWVLKNKVRSLLGLRFRFSSH